MMQQVVRNGLPNGTDVIHSWAHFEMSRNMRQQIAMATENKRHRMTAGKVETLLFFHVRKTMLSIEAVCTDALRTLITPQ